MKRARSGNQVGAAVVLAFAVGVVSLGSAVDTADPVVLDQLAKARSKEAADRASACRLLGWAGDPAATPVLVGCLKDASADVRKAAALGCMLLGDANAADALIDAVAEWEDSARWDAVSALSRCATRAHTPKLLDRFLHGSDKEAGALAGLLIQMRDPRVVEPMRKAAKSADRRWPAFRVLRGFQDVRGEMELVMLFPRAENVDVRRRALSMLGYPAARRAVEIVIRAMTIEPDASIRKTAARVLGDIGGPKAVEALRAALRDVRKDVAADAARSLGRLGDRKSIPLLRTILDDPEAVKDHNIASGVLCALGELEAQEAVPRLLTVLESGASQLHGTAARALGRIGDRRAVGPLLPLLKREDTFQAAAAALRDLADPNSVPALMEAIDRRPSTMNFDVYRALGRIGDRRAVPLLIEKLRHGDKNSRRNAAEALTEIGDRRAIPAMMEALRKHTIWYGLPQCIGIIGDASCVPELRRLAREGPWRTRRLAIQSLGYLKARDAAGEIAEWLRTERIGFLRMAAAEALGQMGSRKRYDSLLAATCDRNLNVRTAAIRALGHLKDPRAVEPVLELLEAPHTADRTAAVLALGELGDRRAIGPLMRLMRGGHLLYRQHVVRALEGLPGPTADAALTELREHHDATVRRLAVEALKKRSGQTE